jgi:hypothetical protein
MQKTVVSRLKMCLQYSIGQRHARDVSGALYRINRLLVAGCVSLMEEAANECGYLCQDCTKAPQWLTCKSCEIREGPSLGLKRTSLCRASFLS